MKQNGANGTTNKRSRQERALEQRREQLFQWKHNGVMKHQGRNRPGDPGVTVESKITKAEAEIKTLERRLGVVKSDA